MVEVGEDSCGSESCPSGSSKCFTMDESFLNDLLECSVCLEQLDSSSKVLPCQHTFCKRCLHEIVNSHKELRCPECRILVDANIDELPCNILLVRLLEGIKNNVRPKRTISSCVDSSAQPVLRSSRPESPSPPHHPQLPVQVSNNSTSELMRTSVPKQIFQPSPCAKALYPYEAKVPGDLSFRKGDIILLRKRVDQNWFYGELGEKSGFVPASFVQVVVPIATHVPQCKALYDFHIGSNTGEKECLLTFGKGDVLNVIRRVDDHWAEGKLRERIGIFPISFVEMNAAARALMKLSANMISCSSNFIPPPAPSSDSCFVPVMPVTTTTNTTTSTVCHETSPSISSPPTVMSVATTSHFSSAFASPVHSTSPSLSVNAGSQVFSPMLCTSIETLAQQRPPFSQPSSDGCVLEDAGSEQPPSLLRPRSTPSPVFSSVAPPVITQRAESMSCPKTFPEGADVGVLLSMPHFDDSQAPSSSSTHVPVPNFYLALYSYRPQKDDELELKKGELYTVSEKCHDGWYRGTSLRTAQCGVFPGNYVQLAKSAVLQTQIIATTATHTHNSTSPPPATSSLLENSCQSKGQVTTETSVHSLSISFSSNSNCLALASRAPSPVSVSNIIHQQQPQRLIRATHPCTQVIYKPVEVQSKSMVLSSSRVSSVLPWSTDYGPVSSPLVTEYLPRTATSSPSHMLTYQVASTSGCSLLTDGLAQSRYCVSQPSTPLTSSTTNPFVATAGPSTTTGTYSLISAGPTSQTRLEKHKEKKEKEIVSLMKRLTKRKSKSPPPSDFSCDNPSFVDLTSSGPTLATVHVRSTSCPSEALGSQGISHKKTGSFDSCGNIEVSRSSLRPKQPAPLIRERFRCIVPYPPNSDYELELKVGDVVYVHKKRDDGWYKGTLQRTGKTGLFPSSFVEGF